MDFMRCSALRSCFRCWCGWGHRAVRPTGFRRASADGWATSPSVYAVHYPLMYLFFAWLIKTGQFTLAETWPVVIAVILGSLLLAWLSLKFYDIPLRRWLSRRFQPKTGAGGH